MHQYKIRRNSGEIHFSRRRSHNIPFSVGKQQSKHIDIPSFGSTLSPDQNSFQEALSPNHGDQNNSIISYAI